MEGFINWLDKYDWYIVGIGGGTSLTLIGLGKLGEYLGRRDEAAKEKFKNIIGDTGVRYNTPQMRGSLREYRKLQRLCSSNEPI